MSGNKDAIIFVLDTSPSMWQTNEDGSEGKPDCSAMEKAVQALSLMIQQKVRKG